MAKGTLHIEFESTEDLLTQLRVLVSGVSIGAGLATPAAGINAARGWPLSDTRGATGLEATKAKEPTETVAKMEKAAVEPLAASKPPEPLRQEPEPVVEQRPEPVEELAAEGDTAPAAGRITLENLSSVPYPELLAFCQATPAVGIDATRSANPFLRPVVEHKVKAYLSTRG